MNQNTLKLTGAVAPFPSFVGQEFTASPVLATNGEATINGFKCVLEDYAVKGDKADEPLKSNARIQVLNTKRFVEPPGIPVIDPTNSDTVYFIRSDRVMKTINGGRTSSVIANVSLGNDVYITPASTAISPNGKKIIVCGYDHGLIHIGDDGVSWSQATIDNDLQRVIAICFVTDSIVLAGVRTRSSKDRIYISRDGASTWTVAKEVGANTQAILAIASDGQNVIAVGQGGYIHRSRNQGSSFVSTKHGSIELNAIKCIGPDKFIATKLKYMGRVLKLAASNTNVADIIDNQGYGDGRVSAIWGDNHGNILVAVSDTDYELAKDRTLIRWSNDHGGTFRTLDKVQMSSPSDIVGSAEKLFCGSFFFNSNEYPVPYFTIERAISPSRTAQKNNWLAYAKAL